MWRTTYFVINFAPFSRIASYIRWAIAAPLVLAVFWWQRWRISLKINANDTFVCQMLCTCSPWTLSTHLSIYPWKTYVGESNYWAAYNTHCVTTIYSTLHWNTNYYQTERCLTLTCLSVVVRGSAASKKTYKQTTQLTIRTSCEALLSWQCARSHSHLPDILILSSQWGRDYHGKIYIAWHPHIRWEIHYMTPGQ